MKNGLTVFIASFIFSLLTARPALAVCPICTVAVGAGLGLSRWFGIDDSISGLWIGGLIVSFILWTIDWLNKLNKHFPFSNTLVTVGYFLAVIVPLYYAKIIAHPYAFLCSCAHDKLILGIAAGASGFYFGAILYEYLKEKNNGHAHFPYEKVVMPIIPLVILSLLFYLLTK